MVSFEKLYDAFLSTISSYTLSQMSDDDVRAELFNIASNAITRFKFPKVSLSYSLNELEGKYYFDNNVTQKELNVIIAHMKVVWLEFQISKEQRFQMQYYDNNVKTFSMGNILAQLNRMYENFVKQAKDIEYNYGRVNINGGSTIGNINHD